MSNIIKRNNPEVFHKGFTTDTFSYSDTNPVLTELYVSGIPEGISRQEREIIEKVIQSNDKVKEGRLIEKEDFVLTGHEIVELEKIKKKDIPRFLVYRYKYNKYPQLYLIDDFPPCVQIELSSLCNYRCVMCFQKDPFFRDTQNPSLRNMPFALYREIIDQIEGKVEAVTLACRGEPLINKDFVKMMEYSAHKFLGFKINTNASLLTEKKCHAILSSMNVGTIVFSVDSDNEEMYEKIRVNGKFKKVFKNIVKFKEIKEKYYSDSKMITRISGVHINSEQDFKAIETFWAKHVDQVALINYFPWENAYENKKNDITAPCGDLWRRIFIWSSGLVNSCDYDYKGILSIGNVMRASVSSIWRSDVYENLRRKHLEGQRNSLAPCSQCPMV
tara:strand:+ start:266 stop:1429 length:1164 start_codon:yes stop_codon:yes gene_type:complete